MALCASGPLLQTLGLLHGAEGVGPEECGWSSERIWLQQSPAFAVVIVVKETLVLALEGLAAVSGIRAVGGDLNNGAEA